jgi:hypothetical protein
MIGCEKKDSQDITPNKVQSSKNILTQNKDAGSLISFEDTINNVVIHYSSQFIENDLQLNIEVNQEGNSQNSINESITVEASWESLSNNMPAIISEIQQRLSVDFTFSEITAMSAAMEEMVGMKIQGLNESELKDLRIQGLFISNSILKSIRRQVFLSNQNPSNPQSHLLTNNTNSVHEGFKREMTAFTLSEDVILDVNNIINAVQGDQQFALDKGATFFPTMLNGYQHSNITFYDFEQMVLSYTTNNPNDFDSPTSPSGLSWPRGSDHGCCGNYSGPCYYWHPVCWAHDKLCSDCEPGWFCFSGCVPD